MNWHSFIEVVTAPSFTMATQVHQTIIKYAMEICAFLTWEENTTATVQTSRVHSPLMGGSRPSSDSSTRLFWQLSGGFHHQNNPYQNLTSSHETCGYLVFAGQ